MEKNKKCNSCQEVKSILEFAKKYKTKDGIQKYSPICKVCFNIKDSERRKTEEYKKNKKLYDQSYYEQNQNDILQRKKEYHKENKEEILEKKKNYRSIPSNRERAKNYIKKYKVENREKYYEYRRRHPHIIAWRRMLYRSLYYLGTEKEGTTLDMLGYSSVQLKHHIEKQFKDGMTWENYGEWEIDHIRPLTSFSVSDKPHVVNSLSN
ncbi:MAG: hypothetical protein ACOC3Z_02650, partial [Nanoarchaeota archaeon]